MPYEALLPLVLAAALFLWWLWLGRDPARGVVVPTWEPPAEIRPGPAGALVDQRADPGDVLATILDLARRGYLRIVESHPAGVPAKGGSDAAIARMLLDKSGAWETEWRFERTDKPVDDLLPFEGAVLFALFEDSREAGARALRTRIPTHLPGIYRSFYDHLMRRGYFLRSPAAARREWQVLAAIIGAGGLAASQYGREALAVSLLVCAGLVVLFGWWMPVPTRRGAKMRDRLEGLREYLRRAEAEELEARHAPQKTPELFEELLPWAIALDVSDLWVREFSTMIAETPRWYVREGHHTASPEFAATLTVFCVSALSALADT